MSTAKVGDPKLIEQEIAIMRKYSHLHENIVQYFEHFSSQRHIYLVLEFCPGGDLSKYIKTRGRLTEEIARGFLKQISNGLHFLHSKNIMHRDLKPANILLSEDSRHAILKIADFGIAKQLRGAVSMSRTQAGTPLYMAPEIYEMQGYDAKADVWYVGSNLLLLSHSPFYSPHPTTHSLAQECGLYFLRNVGGLSSFHGPQPWRAVAQDTHEAVAGNTHSLLF